ncbi:MAG: efflux RND transporter periplasmic adaptor subunit [Candidatus Accumulibacter sp.]|jgi:membrane fusion protein (multidrug efflux system)|nr:efflux RND transporter periplasmic adaptor subunit [Accumulibacter sp.]
MSAQDTPSPIVSAPGADIANGRGRGWALAILTLVLLLIAAACGAYWYHVARWQESTDDAYVAGHIVQITPQVGGTVKAVFVDDTDAVAAGDLLVELDSADGKVALDQAEAALAQAVREVRALHVNNERLRAEAAARQTEVRRLETDVARRAAIAATGAVSREDLDHSRTALTVARSARRAAREQLAANLALTEGVEIDDHPRVLQAASRVEETWLAWSRTRIVAPLAGQVVKRSVQAGQRVAAGATLMAVVPLDRLWVDANFKEVQLGRMRIGQPVTLRADYYGSKVEYHGRVTGLAAGTGSAFALLPAQNATGNWIKVVQRVPVRVELEAAELARHPLRIGLSMQVTADFRDNGGEAVAARTVRAADDLSRASDGALDAARSRIAEIIRRHGAAGGK